ncbi:MAG: AtpZ/AtpI family protein [Candidatus Zixiibacteriota bacterium]
MSLLEPEQKGEKGRAAKQLALLTAIPAILIVAPLVGFFIGQWVDKKAGTAPLFVILGLLAGFAAAGIEIRSLIKKGTGSENSHEKEN